MKLVAGVLLMPMALGLFAQPAMARPPSGSADTCTASFEALTLEQLLAQAARNGIPEQNARNLFESVNKNEDDWICSKDQPSPQLNHYNFVDNQAVGQAR